MWYFGMLGTCYPMVYHPWVVRNIFNSYSMSPFPWMWATFYQDLQMHISHVTPYSYVRPGIQWCTTIEWSETFWAMWQLLLHCLFMKWPCDHWSLMTLWFCFTLFLFWAWHLKVYHSWMIWDTPNMGYICVYPYLASITLPSLRWPCLKHITFSNISLVQV